MFQGYSEDFFFLSIVLWDTSVKQRRIVSVLPGRCCCGDCGREDPSLLGAHSQRWLITGAVCSLIKTGLKAANRRLPQLPAATVTPPHSTRRSQAPMFLHSDQLWLFCLPGRVLVRPSGIAGEEERGGGGSLWDEGLGPPSR